MTDTHPERINCDHARPRCLACKKLFTPEPRTGQRQKYCSTTQCQSQRLRMTKRAWLEKEENKRFRKAQQRRWRKGNPEYLGQWRKKHPESVQQNRELTRRRMRLKRRRSMFEKSIDLRSQVVRSKGVIYTNRESTLILMRLKRGCGLSMAWADGYACERTRSGPIRLPQGRLYKVSGSS